MVDLLVKRVPCCAGDVVSACLEGSAGVCAEPAGNGRCDPAGHSTLGL